MVWWHVVWSGHLHQGCLGECRSTFQPDMLDVLTSHWDPRSLWSGFLKPTPAFFCTYRLGILPPKRACAECAALNLPSHRQDDWRFHKVLPTFSWSLGNHTRLPGGCRIRHPSNRSQSGVSCSLLLAAGSRQARKLGQECRVSLDPEPASMSFRCPPTLSLWLLTPTDWWALKPSPVGGFEGDYPRADRP